MMRHRRTAVQGAAHWRDVDLIENRLRAEDSKTETGERSIARQDLGRDPLAAPQELGVPGRRRARVLPP